MNETSSLPPWLEFFTFSNINVTFVFLGCMLLGMSTGVLGCFAFLRKRSLLGDALAHAAWLAQRMPAGQGDRCCLDFLRANSP